MAPSKTSWDDEEEDSTPPSSPPAVAVRRGKFDDEEDEDVLESWDAAEDSEEEREKAKNAAEAKAKADAAAKAAHKSKSERLEEIREQRRRQKAVEDDEEESGDEDEADKRARLRASEKESDLQHAEDLFGGVGGVPASRSAPKAITVQEGDDPNDAIDLSKLKIFNPTNAKDFNKLREVLVPLLNQNGKKAHYELFMKEFTKQIVKDLNSQQVKNVASVLTTISNEKMREEKAAEKGGKKSKAAKTKTTLNANKNLARDADTAAYDDDGLDE
ncbi:hypothetical protein M409DRAFT_66538 [Zasmidium cellare ATCC 36951]|uniref:Eukaryotic translation initiation factor 3 subunit J n=1 Tax=Zasmidium cellare ATCC 36951 TaxID=1080233 RepID=A0A6A6CIR1_ZASCE|nr:uncharacterized protein M409DRAFT_66538 [Zasmidium cellare ATCC 36951]KAF2166493.1 hypothetical protein M409DRAFT_66538 [Zasmidium cellare ATCC 36951]